MALLTKIGNWSKFTDKCHRFYCCSASKKGLVLGVFTDGDKNDLKLTSAAAEYNDACGGKLVENLKLAGNKANKVFWGLTPEYNAVAVVDIGKEDLCHNVLENIDEKKQAIRKAACTGCKSLVAAKMDEIHMSDLTDAEAAAEAGTLSLWKYQGFKTKKDVIPCLFPYDIKEDDVWNRGKVKGDAQNFARLLADTPANHMTPTIFADTVCEALGKLGVSVQVGDKCWAEQHKMGAFLSVSRGSKEPLKFLEICYNGAGSKADRPFVLIGKGVTFDTGGISLKPSLSMDLMRADMGGAAAVVGAVHALASLKSPVYVKALIPLCENMPSGSATKPGDVVTAMNGKSICVDNTDAEGRLILADALCYSKTLCPRWVLDIATLTGAMKVALGASATGVFSNSDALWAELSRAGCVTGDRMWRFPLWKYYTDQVTKFNAYDVNNAPNVGGGGACTAAAFLREFVPQDTDWLHLDMAGVMGADKMYAPDGMSGRPTRTLVQFIEQQICE